MQVRSAREDAWAREEEAKALRDKAEQLRAALDERRKDLSSYREQLAQAGERERELQVGAVAEGQRACAPARAEGQRACAPARAARTGGGSCWRPRQPICQPLRTNMLAGWCARAQRKLLDAELRSGAATMGRELAEDAAVEGSVAKLLRQRDAANRALQVRQLP